MYRILAIETSGSIGSIALAEGATILAEEQFPHGLRHAAEIVPMIDRLCRSRGWSPQDLEHLYVSAGPGSFTGLRIGITLAKTLALATGVKLVAVPSVRVLAENAPPEAKHLVIVLDAKREQIFTARFERMDGGITPSPGTPGEGRGGGFEFEISNLKSQIKPPPQPSPGVPGEGAGGPIWVEREPAHLDSLAAMLARSPRPVHLLGEGIPYHKAFIPGDADVIITPPESWRARAGAVVEIGAKLAAAGEFADPDRLTPIYIRKPEAQEKLEGP